MKLGVQIGKDMKLFLFRQGLVELLLIFPESHIYKIVN